MTSTYGDIVDSRAILAELRDLLEDSSYDYSDEPEAEVWATLDDEDRDRVDILRTLLDDLPESTVDSLRGHSWGSTLVAEDYFTEYARELASALRAISGDEQWPLSFIDWERAADALKPDYTTVELDGITYYAR